MCYYKAFLLAFSFATTRATAQLDAASALDDLAIPRAAAQLDAPSSLDSLLQSLPLGSAYDMVPDYSFAGAYYSAKALPPLDRPATVTLQPTKDDTDRTQDIQDAIDSLNLVGGGVVELAAGVYTLSSTSVRLYTQNVTLRGALAAPGASSPTTVLVSGPPRFVFTIGDPAADISAIKSSQSNITDAYVPVGSRTLSVKDASVFQVGQEIRITKTLSAAWIDSVGMDDLYRDGAKQTWIAPGKIDAISRAITAVDVLQNTLTIDVPLVDSINSSYGTNAMVSAYTLPRNLAMGNSIESLQVVLEKDESGNSLKATSFDGVAVFSAFSQDNWIRRVSTSGFLTFFHTAQNSRRTTIQDVFMYRATRTSNDAGYPADIQVQGASTLVLRCTTIGVEGSKSWSVATGSLTPGPTAVVQYRSYLSEHITEPHMRWASGFLLDNSRVGGAFLINRGSAGSGHGIATANSLVWNTRALGQMGIQTPPGAFNLCVRCSYTSIAKGSSLDAFISPTATDLPESLFEAQLSRRMGAAFAAALVAPPAVGSTESTVSVEVEGLPPPPSGARFVLQEAKRCPAFKKAKRGTQYFGHSAASRAEARFGWAVGVLLCAVVAAMH